MYNLDYITTKTKEEIKNDLKYNINKYDEKDLEIIYELYEDDIEICLLIAINYNTNFETLRKLSYKNNEDVFLNLLENNNIYNYYSIIVYINEKTKNILNLHLSEKLIKNIQEWIY